jgi:hypothetical protein
MADLQQACRGGHKPGSGLTPEVQVLGKKLLGKKFRVKAWDWRGLPAKIRHAGGGPLPRECALRPRVPGVTLRTYHPRSSIGACTALARQQHCDPCFVSL